MPAPQATHSPVPSKVRTVSSPSPARTSSSPAPGSIASLSLACPRRRTARRPPVSVSAPRPPTDGLDVGAGVVALVRLAVVGAPVERHRERRDPGRVAQCVEAVAAGDRVGAGVDLAALVLARPGAALAGRGDRVARREQVVSAAAGQRVVAVAAGQQVGRASRRLSSSVRRPVPPLSSPSTRAEPATRSAALPPSSRSTCGETLSPSPAAPSSATPFADSVNAAWSAGRSRPRRSPRRPARHRRRRPRCPSGRRSARRPARR